ncbi:hypothetical protein GDO81_010844 [Engystomops pustulosus]|uniref:Cadherin domain-containing protein n=1 Tax=Engystomops pustulosus TaxID=76066 RepID=A0AAV7C345_ENGPU|nr:hypothetical protein GDO81_010844 [Engystomops pustulosus]
MIWQVLFCFSSFYIKNISGQLQYSIPEELKKGSVVGNVAKDLEINVKELVIRKFQIVSRVTKQYFSVNLENGDLIASEKIDRESLCGAKLSCFINLEAVIENPLNFYTISIEIQDINDNAPVFSKKHYNISISESALPGIHFPLGNAEDPDLGTNSIQSYSLSSNEWFSLDVKSSKEGIKYPEIILEQSLDREKKSFHEFILTASDGGKPSKTGTAIIRITVQDVNDNFPAFMKDTYHIRLPENSLIGSLVIQLNATDEDEGTNGLISYSFSRISNNADQLFSIESTKGEISIIGSLDYETSDNYEITVEAKDGGGYVTHCKVFIQVIDVNDNAPDITVTTLAGIISEDSPPGTVIAIINVHDLDSGINGEVACQISDLKGFQLLPSSSNYYKLVTAVIMDRERNSIYNVTIQCMDNGSPPLSTNKSIQLTISDVNDNAPVFEKINYIVYIMENNQPGTSVQNILASDIDEGENGKITYSIVSSNIDNIPVSSYVSINSMKGSNVTARICIIDKNDNAPKILYPSPDTEGSALFEFIPHSAEKGYLVTKVIAVDADSGHNAWLSYHLLQVPDPTLFGIEQHTGEIKIIRDLQDVENLRQKIVVLVKDNGVPSLSSTVALNLVVAENFQQVVPEIKTTTNSDKTSHVTFYLLLSLLHMMCVVTLDSKQNEIAYLKPVQNVPTDNLIDTDDTAAVNDSANLPANNTDQILKNGPCQEGEKWLQR